jgi:branched-chain amino acid aminotransferase
MSSPRGTSETVVWVDGALRHPGEASVSALDHGMIVGDGVFETCKVVDGVPFALTRHLQRLDRSAEGLGLPVPQHPVVRGAVMAVLAENPFPLGRLRITWTAGPGPLGSDRGGGEPTLVVAASEAAPWPEEVGVVRVPWTRNERAPTTGLKTTSYADNVLALAYARDRGGAEALFANTRGELCEGTGANVFVVVDGELVTPPLTSGALAGITRGLLLQWASQEGLPCRERTLPFDVLDDVDEVLLTSSTRDVQPQMHLDGRRLATGELGQAAIELFRRKSGEDVDPL